MNVASSTSRLRIRPGQSDDAPLILALIRELADFEGLAHEVTATEELLRRSLFGDRPGAETLIAEWDGKPAGFALYFSNYSTFLAQQGLYLEDLFVRPEFRSRGIGRELLVELARVAQRRGCGRLEWSVLDWNERALAFYRSLGAKPMSEWTVQRLDREAIAALAQAGKPDSRS